jgi:hypothetical protein
MPGRWLVWWRDQRFRKGKLQDQFPTFVRHLQNCCQQVRLTALIPKNFQDHCSCHLPSVIMVAQFRAVRVGDQVFTDTGVKEVTGHEHSFARWMGNQRRPSTETGIAASAIATNRVSVGHHFDARRRLGKRDLEPAIVCIRLLGPSRSPWRSTPPLRDRIGCGRASSPSPGEQAPLRLAVQSRAQRNLLGTDLGKFRPRRDTDALPSHTSTRSVRRVAIIAHSDWRHMPESPGSSIWLMARRRRCYPPRPVPAADLAIMRRPDRPLWSSP